MINGFSPKTPTYVLENILFAIGKRIEHGTEDDVAEAQRCLEDFLRNLNFPTNRPWNKNRELHWSEQDDEFHVTTCGEIIHDQMLNIFMPIVDTPTAGGETIEEAVKEVMKTILIEANASASRN